ncbi:flagellar assembly protein H [Sphingomonas sp. XMGL2]|uniref:Flagellar assembly protein H n=1 Tax=Sphingomonas quercus TaxID=2842451 RepID=A0ABS6BK46_9SPHN|nr:flagellar assembly protein H [Sphingomonas quercus]
MHHASSDVRPFRFDRVFSNLHTTEPRNEAEMGVEAEEDEVVSELREAMARMARDHGDELARARADGFEAGLRHARGERDAAVLAALDAVHASFDDVDQRLVAAADGMTRDAANVALLIGEALAGHALAQDPGRAIDEALGRVLQQVARGTRLVIRVSPGIVGEVERLFALRQGKERRKLYVTVLPDPDMSHGDAVIAWDEGSLAIDSAARRAAVMAEMAPLLAGMPVAERVSAEEPAIEKEIDPARIA